MKKLFITALTALSVLTASAQSSNNETKACCGGCGFQPTWFLNLQGGIQLPNSPGMSKLISPAYSLNFGRNITPLVSARVGIEGMNSKVFNQYTNVKEKFKYATGSFDAMLDLLNVISCKPRPVSLYAIGGVGLNWSEMKTTNSSHFSPNVRLGAQLDWKVAKNFSLNLEYRADNTNDQFDGRLQNGHHDWYTSLYFGVSFRFGGKKKKAAPVAAPRPVVETKAEPKVVTVVDTTYKKVPVVLHEESFYKISKFEAKGKTQQTDNVANFLNTYTDATVTVTGYADKGTGTAKINSKYAKKRANAFKNNLVKEYNINADRIKTDSKGDTVQPFAENDKNRCVIVEGKAEKTVKETKSRQVTVNE